MGVKLRGHQRKQDFKIGEGTGASIAALMFSGSIQPSDAGMVYGKYRKKSQSALELARYRRETKNAINIC